MSGWTRSLWCTTARIVSRGRRRLRAPELGRQGEARAAWYLRLRGYRILARNVRYPEGELDLVVRRRGVLAFVEVKSRQQTRCGTPAEAVGRVKQLRIARMAERYCRERRIAREVRVRFDVVSVYWTGWRFRIEHLRDAFYVEAQPGRPWVWR
jgi:putative endonuclease